MGFCLTCSFKYYHLYLQWFLSCLFGNVCNFPTLWCVSCRCIFFATTSHLISCSSFLSFHCTFNTTADSSVLHSAVEMRLVGYQRLTTVLCHMGSSVLFQAVSKIACSSCVFLDCSKKPSFENAETGFNWMVLFCFSPLTVQDNLFTSIVYFCRLNFIFKPQITYNGKIQWVQDLLIIFENIFGM